MKKLIVFAIAIFGFTAVSFGQASETATATGTIIIPIAIDNTVNMNFGTVAVQNATGGTVILTPANTRSTGGDGGVTLPNFNLGTVTSASFNITGQGDYTYSITLPSTPTVVSAGAGLNMNVDNFTSNPSSTGKLDGTGKQTLTVGATLNVNPAQAPGTYVSATPFTVTVNYN